MSGHNRLERDLVKCEDMRLHAERAVRFLGGRSLDEFLDDELVQAAVIRCVEVIGEAAKLVSDETRAREPGIPWRLVIGMRSVLAHEYGVVMPEKVHEVVTEHVPALLELLVPLIAVLEAEVGWDADSDEVGS
ncbi:MAG: DUF86 domain-containing protein [Phycisphaerales bacterium]|nr:DUF86 domain-containing protein [Phycisphaerales bacterium]